jgi:hypothetical protein
MCLKSANRHHSTAKSATRKIQVCGHNDSPRAKMLAMPTGLNTPAGKVATNGFQACLSKL